MRSAHLFVLGLLPIACHPPWDSGESAVPDSDTTDTDGDSGDTGLPGHAPVVDFTGPPEGAGLWEGAPATFTLTATDSDGDLEHVEASSDLQGGLGWAYDLGGYWALDASLQAGQHSILAAAFDEAGHTGVDAIDVTSRACTAYSRDIPCRFTFEGEEAPMSVADNANSMWECQALVRGVDGEPAELDLGAGRFGDGVELERDGTSLETWLPEGAGVPPWTVQLWFRGDGACPSPENDYPLMALVTPKGAAISRISAGTLAIEVEEAGSVSSGDGEVLATAWEDQTWHLFALSATADGVVSAWLDGEASPFFTHDAGGIPDFANGVLRVGASADGQTTWCGSLDDVAFSNAEFDELDFAWTWEAATPFCLGEPL